MKCYIPKDKFDFLMNELRCSFSHASELAISALLDDRNEQAKTYAKRAKTLESIIKDITMSATDD